MITAVITTLDNLPILERQVELLRHDPLIDRIIVVNNGSADGTRSWLDANGADLTVIHRENHGAGPGRNAGLDAAGPFDYVLMLDGGILPLVGGVAHMLDYLERHPEVAVLGLEIADMVTDESQATTIWPGPIADDGAYRNRCLSHTAYCLARAAAFDGLRFSEEGPFAQPGWGVDDDEMSCQWNEAGIVVHVLTGVKVFRRASGSFQRLFDESGIWPNQYGSVYEQRLVFCQQRWPQYQRGIQWGEPWLTIVIRGGDDVDTLARLVKYAHDQMRLRHFAPPWDGTPNPYSVILWTSPDSPVVEWARPRCLRQHHGDTILLDGTIVRRTPDNEDTWTGDFRVEHGDDYHAFIRPNAHYYGLATNLAEVDALVEKYNALHEPGKGVPDVRGVEITA